MQKKDPQGTNDPQPTPERELERYGVWVKAEPRDLIDDSILGESQSDASAMADIDAMPLSADGEDLLEPLDNQSADGADASLDGLDDLPPLADFDSGADSAEAHSPVPLGDVQLDDVPLDEFELEDIPAGEPEQAAASDSPSLEASEVNIEDFDLDDDSSGAPSLESIGEVEPAEAKSPISDDFESLDIDLEFDDTIPSEGEEAAQAAPSTDSEFESVELDSIDESGPEAGIAGSELDIEPVAMDSFIDADESAEASVLPDVQMEDVSLDMAEAPAPSARDEAASDLMATIARELSSIKEELVSLRSQLGELKASGGSTPAPAPIFEEEVQEEQSSGGFFDDEDDDTIALTGDELDNILNTADFTEEAASDESLPDDAGLDLEIPSGIDLLPEDGDYSKASEPGIETFEADEAAAPVELTEMELTLDPEEGVTPLISPPADTSFLDDDSEATLELDEEPLEEAPLVEPDLDDLDIIIDSTFGAEEEELPIAEPAVEEVEIAEQPEDAVSEPEIVLDLPDDAEPVISTVDAFAEPIAEVEDAESLDDADTSTELGGLELHAEESLPEAGLEAPADLAEPIVHPDDLSTSLDDSLFVENPEAEAVEAVDFSDTADLGDIVESEQVPEAEESLLPIEEPIEEALAEAPRDAGTEPKPEPAVKAERATSGPEPSAAAVQADVPDKLKQDVKSVLVYLDQLLASLPEEKIEEFASSEYYDTYRRLFDDLGLI